MTDEHLKKVAPIIIIGLGILNILIPILIGFVAGFTVGVLLYN